MGMFDYIKCEYPVPDTEVQHHSFQTKDFNNLMDTYTISNEGRLIYHKTKTVEVPKEERPYWGKPEWDEDGLFSLIGSQRNIPVADIDMDFHGILNFYTYIGDVNSDSDYVWYEYNAKFTEGQLVELTRK